MTRMINSAFEKFHCLFNFIRILKAYTSTLGVGGVVVDGVVGVGVGLVVVLGVVEVEVGIGVGLVPLTHSSYLGETGPATTLHLINSSLLE